MLGWISRESWAGVPLEGEAVLKIEGDMGDNVHAGMNCEKVAQSGLGANSKGVCKALNECDANDGDVMYFRIHFCTLRGVRILSTVLLIVWLAVLIYVMFWVAEDYLCPALAGIAEDLHLSSDVAGVTLLALGNGAPDIR